MVLNFLNKSWFFFYLERNIQAEHESSWSCINKRREDPLTVNHTKHGIPLCSQQNQSVVADGRASKQNNAPCSLRMLIAQGCASRALSVLQTLFICSHTSTQLGVVGGGGQPVSQECVGAERLPHPAKGLCLHAHRRETYSFSLILPLDLVPSLMCGQETTWAEAAGIKYYSGNFLIMQK